MVNKILYLGRESIETIETMEESDDWGFHIPLRGERDTYGRETPYGEELFSIGVPESECDDFMSKCFEEGIRYYYWTVPEDRRTEAIWTGLNIVRNTLRDEKYKGLKNGVLCTDECFTDTLKAIPSRYEIRDVASVDDAAREQSHTLELGSYFVGRHSGALVTIGDEIMDIVYTPSGSVVKIFGYRGPLSTLPTAIDKKEGKVGLKIRIGRAEKVGFFKKREQNPQIASIKVIVDRELYRELEAHLKEGFERYNYEIDEYLTSGLQGF